MQITFQAHHATITDQMRARITRAVTRAAARCDGVVGAAARLETDGPTSHVELVVTWPRRRLVARGRARAFRDAITLAARHLEAQLWRVKRHRMPRPRPRATT